MKKPLVERIELLQYGVFKKTSTGNFREDDNDSPTGYFIRTDDIELINKTNLIKAQIGTIFGIKYNLIGKFPDELVDFKCKINHPKQINPKTNVKFSSTIEHKSDFVNEENFDFFEFENQWEIKNGTWCFQVIVDDRVLLSQEFEVIQAA